MNKFVETQQRKFSLSDMITKRPSVHSSYIPSFCTNKPSRVRRVETFHDFRAHVKWLHVDSSFSSFSLQVGYQRVLVVFQQVLPNSGYIVFHIGFPFDLSHAKIESVSVIARHLFHRWHRIASDEMPLVPIQFQTRHGSECFLVQSNLKFVRGPAKFFLWTVLIKQRHYEDYSPIKSSLYWCTLKAAVLGLKLVSKSEKLKPVP